MNEEASNEMIEILDVGRCFSIFDPLDHVIASKCGLTKKNGDMDISNDAMVLEDRVTSLKYVVVTVMRNPSLASTLRIGQYGFLRRTKDAIAAI